VGEVNLLRHRQELEADPPAVEASVEPEAEASHVAGGSEVTVAVKLFAFDAMLQLNPSGGASGEGMVAVEEGSVLAVRLRSGEAPAVVPQ
jgi:hypothetical protein